MARSTAALLALLIVNMGCAVRPPQTYRLVRQANGRILIPPGVAAPDLARRAFTADIAAGRGKCPQDQGGIEIRPHGNNIRIAVNRDAILRQPPGWLSQWTAAAESEGCIAAGAGLKLADRIIESVPLDPGMAYQLLHASDRQTGYVDLGPENRLQVNSPIRREGAAADAPAVESAAINGLTVEVKTSSNLLGFEIAWYALRPKPDSVGYAIIPMSAERHFQDRTETVGAPATNFFQFAPQAAYYRLFFKTDQGTTRILVAAAASRAGLNRATQAPDSGPDPCRKFGSQMCVLLPQHVAANPDVVVSVNGRDIALAVGATLDAAIKAAGEQDPRRLLPRLMVRRLYAGKPVALEFDRSEPEILRIVLRGGEEISWQ